MSSPHRSSRSISATGDRSCSGSHARRLEWLSVLGLSLALAITALVSAVARGATGIARNDDWSYANTAFTWAESGELSLNGWVHMMFIGQGALGALASWWFEPSIYVLQSLVLATAVAGLLATYRLARYLLAAPLALVVVGLTGLSPLWLNLSVSFMTDIPAWAASVSSLLLGVSALNRRSRWRLLGAVALGFVAFSIREYGIVPVLGVLVWSIPLNKSNGARRFSAVLMVSSLMALAAVFAWRQSLPGSISTERGDFLPSVELVSQLLIALGFLLSPYLLIASVFAWPCRHQYLAFVWRNRGGLVVGLVVACVVIVFSSGQMLGNVIHPYGSSWTTVGDGVRAMPPTAFRLLNVIGAFCLVVVSVSTGSVLEYLSKSRNSVTHFRGHSTVHTAGLLAFVSGINLILYAALTLIRGTPIFDRYLLLIVPLLGMVILWSATRSAKNRFSRLQTGVVAATLAVTGALGIVIADSHNHIDGLRWEAASDLVTSGIPAHKVDSGDAWFRFHQRGIPGVAQVGSLENSIPGRTWWQTFFKGSTFCRMVAIESETDLQAMYGPALSIQEERTLLGTPFRVIVFPGPDPC